MLLAHARTLAQARSHLAALADTSATIDAAIGYDRILLQIDALHDDDEIPAITPVDEPDRDVLFTLAEAAIENLTTHGIDALSVELVLNELHTARVLDRS
ncbi:MAG: hypothetical protein GX643_09615 [Acidimicrobiales bacterium]|nr:hypothetical protein [Acidimicrobiales bacterium]